MPIPKVFPVDSRKGKDVEDSNKSSQQQPAAVAVPSTAPPKLLVNRYCITKQLGCGNFGTVFLAQDMQNSNEMKVVKKIKIGEVQPNETIEAVKEATLLSQLDHPAIVKFHDSFINEEYFCIVTEFCEGGDLSNMIKEVREAGKILEESLILDWFVQLTNAIRYIHSRRVLHRDLKTRNIFLKEGRIKLGDFGISRILVGTSDYATTFTGTPYYMSPEVLKHEGYDSKSDIWSLGIVLYELCALDHAYKGQNMMAVMYKIVEGIPPRLPDHLNTSLRDLFTRMLNKDPKARPSAVQILQDPFIKHHMELLSHKLTMRLNDTNKTDPIQLSSNHTPKRNISSSNEKSKNEDKHRQNDKHMTPREKMLQRKSQKAEEEAERIKLQAIKNYADNQKRYSSVKKKKNKIIPPWVGEHPDIFDDPNFSITAIDSLQLRDSNHHSEPANTSLMEVSVGASASTKYKPEDVKLADTYYSEFDDFEMEISAGSSECDSDYQAIIECIEEALSLPSIESGHSNSQQLEMEPRPVTPPPPPVSHDELSPFTPLARDKRIALLKEEGRKVLGNETFQKVYSYLKSVRQGDGEVNEGLIMSELKRLTSNTRDCFIIDQLVFLEKQQDNNELF